MTNQTLDQRPSLILENLSTTELDELRSVVKLVIIPVGSLEQHGPNLSLGADTFLAEAASKIVAEELYPQVLLAPAIRWGMSRHHMDFVGTVTLRPETLTLLILDIVNSLCHHGFGRFLLVNGHSGNRAVLETTIVQALQQTDALFLGCCQYFDLGDRRGAGHAAFVEVSYAMHLAPHIVKYAALSDGDLVGPAPLPGSVYVPWPTKRLSRNGPSGKVQGASPELGRQMLAPSLEGLVEVARTIIDEELTVREP